MWPWPMEAADHTGRHVDRRHITDWPRWGSLRHRWTERRLSWCAILFVSRPSIHRARSAWADCGPPVNPISCAAHRLHTLRLLSKGSKTTYVLHSTCREIESNQSPRFYEAVVVKLHEVIHVPRHTGIEAAEQALPNSRARAGGRSTGDRMSTAPPSPVSWRFIFAGVWLPRSFYPCRYVPAPGTRDIVHEAWRRAPLLHFGSSE